MLAVAKFGMDDIVERQLWMTDFQPFDPASAGRTRISLMPSEQGIRDGNYNASEVSEIIGDSSSS